MKTLRFTKLSLENFKGVKSLQIDLSKITNIYGANGTNKTTIADAVSFLFDGKNSEGIADFSIKTLDSDNKPIHHLNHSVYLECDLDGEVIELKRLFREKWVTKRGETIPVLQSHETKYFGNDNVPITAEEFKQILNSIADPMAFKLLTDPLAFNSDFKPKVPGWTARRELLFEMAGQVTDEDIAMGNPDYEQLLIKTKRTGLVEYKKSLKSTITEKQKTLKELPARIDENTKSMPEKEDVSILLKSISDLESDISKLDEQIENSGKADEATINKIKEKKTEILNYENQIEELERKQTADVNKQYFDWGEKKKTLTRELESLQNELRTLENSVKIYNSYIDENNKRAQALREQWNKVNSAEFSMDDKMIVCPITKKVCGDSTMIPDVKELENKFNTNKYNETQEISKKGIAIVEQTKENQSKVNDLEKKINQTKKDITSKQEELKSHEINKVEKTEFDTIPEVISLKNKITIAKASMPEIKPVDNSLLKSQKEIYKNEIKSLQERVSKQNLIVEKTKRVEELKQEIGVIRQEISDSQKIINTIDSFTKEKVSRVEESVNEMFGMAKFKMYEMQLNDGEREICECIYDGVPFSDLNNARKIQVGIDIINTLQKHYGVILPIVIDNRESVIEIPETKGQVVNLIVSKDDTVLRIENN